MKENFVNNRKNMAELMENGSMLVIHAGSAPNASGDAYYPYSPERDFLYLTGIARPHLILTMSKNNEGKVTEKLYLQRWDELEARWNGAMIRKEEAEEISGIAAFGHIDEFARQSALALNSGLFGKIYIDLENRSFKNRNDNLDFANSVQKSFPHIAIANSFALTSELRVCKQDYEIENIRRAIDVSREGFYALLKNVKPGMKEYELEAHLDYTYKLNGTKEAFSTIMASGENATVLHYHDNNCEIKDGDLVLVDYGAAWNWYASDISRTFPANGKFTERQKLLYNIVLTGQNMVIDMIKPGVEFSKLNEALREFYVTELTKIGLITDKEQLSEYYFHGVSHMLGMETHDIGRGRPGLVLAPGMVFTVEPGLYIREEKIGIRIEEDVMVTADGCEVLTAGIIRTIDEIEAYMAEHRA
ncbi:MAG: aminopeptidase P family protein [Defluviitaleaceae bacterium]|nr:aminopeptidase P family protein [Defluviitaleaceae bacterium]